MDEGRTRGIGLAGITTRDLAWVSGSGECAGRAADGRSTVDNVAAASTRDCSRRSLSVCPTAVGSQRINIAWIEQS